MILKHHMKEFGAQIQQNNECGGSSRHLNANENDSIEDTQSSGQADGDDIEATDTVNRSLLQVEQNINGKDDE